MNTRCPPKRVTSATRFFTVCRLTVQPPRSYSVGGQRSCGQLTGKPAGARPDYRGRWCAVAQQNKTEGAMVKFISKAGSVKEAVANVEAQVLAEEIGSYRFLICSVVWEGRQPIKIRLSVMAVTQRDSVYMQGSSVEYWLGLWTLDRRVVGSIPDGGHCCCTLEQVREGPQLYDMSRPDSKDTLKKQNTWDTIAAKLDMSGF
ncbi:UNVERIFIED_CONTAM: hypothetical protein FKN15_024013 [Acipenser sinensis]